MLTNNLQIDKIYWQVFDQILRQGRIWQEVCDLVRDTIWNQVEDTVRDAIQEYSNNAY